MHEKLTKPPDEGRSVKQLFLNSMRLIEYNPSNKMRRWADKAVSRQDRFISRICKQLEADEGGSGGIVQGWRTGRVLLTEGPKTQT